MLVQAVPKFMAPRHSGLTCTPAVGERRRCRPSRDFGSGAELAVMLVCLGGGAKNPARREGGQILERMTSGDIGQVLRRMGSVVQHIYTYL